MGAEQKVVELVEMKVADDGGNGKFTGYGSVFNKIDLVGDTVLPGAYTATLAKFLRDGFIAWGHNWDDPVATVDMAREDERGLYLEASFHSHAGAQRARTITAERLDRGKSMGLSIGYSAKDWKIRSDGVRELITIDLHETSLVTFPAEPNAQVTTVKDGSAGRGRPAGAGGLVEESPLVRLVQAEEKITGLITDVKAMKEGRVLSSRNVQRLKDNMAALRGALEDLEALLADAEPPEKAGEGEEGKEAPDEVRAAESRRVWGEYLAVMSRLNGVTVD